MSMICLDSVTFLVRHLLFLNHETSVAGSPSVRQEMVNSGGLTLSSVRRIKLIVTELLSCPGKNSYFKTDLMFCYIEPMKIAV